MQWDFSEPVLALKIAQGEAAPCMQQPRKEALIQPELPGRADTGAECPWRAAEQADVRSFPVFLFFFCFRNRHSFTQH